MGTCGNKFAAQFITFPIYIHHIMKYLAELIFVYSDFSLTNDFSLFRT